MVEKGDIIEVLFINEPFHPDGGGPKGFAARVDEITATGIVCASSIMKPFPNGYTKIALDPADKWRTWR